MRVGVFTYGLCADSPRMERGLLERVTSFDVVGSLWFPQSLPAHLYPSKGVRK